MGFSSLSSWLIVIVPILLAVAIAWAISHSRTSNADIQRTEEATRKNYAEQDAADKMRDEA